MITSNLAIVMSPFSIKSRLKSIQFRRSIRIVRIVSCMHVHAYTFETSFKRTGEVLANFPRLFCFAIDHAYIRVRIRIRTSRACKTSYVQSIDHDSTYILYTCTYVLYVRNQLIDQIENLPMGAGSALRSQ